LISYRTVNTFHLYYKNQPLKFCTGKVQLSKQADVCSKIRKKKQHTFNPKKWAKVFNVKFGGKKNKQWFEMVKFNV
jgi:hypothetical protein